LIYLSLEIFNKLISSGSVFQLSIESHIMHSIVQVLVFRGW